MANSFIAKNVKRVLSLLVRDGVASLSDDDANVIHGARDLKTGVWASVRTISRLEISGTGALSIDSRDSAGNVSSAAFTGNYDSITRQIEFPYYGDAAVQIRATFPNTLSVKLI